MSITGIFLSITIASMVMYTAYIALLFSLQGKLIFPAPPKNYLLYEALKDSSLSIIHEDSSLQGWKVPGANPASGLVAIYFGGNGEDVGASITNLKRIPAETIYTFNYRGYGLSSGSPTEKLLYEDALRIVDVVKESHPNSQIVIIGYSLGSAIAGYAAAQTNPSYLVLFAPLHSIERIAKERFGPFIFPAIIKHKFNLFNTAKDIRAKTLIICAGADLVIDQQHSRDTFEALSGSKKIVTIANAGHNDLLLKDETFTLMRDFISK